MRLYHPPWSDCGLGCKIIFFFQVMASIKSHWKQWQGYCWFQMYWISPKPSSLLSIQGSTKNVLWFYWQHNNHLCAVGMGICICSLCNLQVCMYTFDIPIFVHELSWRHFYWIFVAPVQSVNSFENHVGIKRIKHSYTSRLWCEINLKELLCFLVTKKK